RGKAKLDPVTVDDESASILLEEELELVAIGPSSSTEGWNRTHLSYALTHHLVEVCIKLSRAMTFPGVDVTDFQARFYWNRGRTSELSLNHEAILGAPSAAPESDANMLGLVRHAPLLDIINQIGDRLEDDRRLELDTASAIDRLGLAWMALEQLHMPEHGIARHRLLGETIIQGMALLERADCPESSREMAGMYLQGLAREELRQSLECGVPSALSPHQNHSIFGTPSTSPAPFVPEDAAIDTPFLSDEASGPACLDLSAQFFGVLEQIYDHLDYVLAYAPQAQLPAAVFYVWRRLDEPTAHYELEFQRVHGNPRYAALPAAKRAIRPSAYLGTITQFEMFQPAVLWGCHLALQIAEASTASRANNEGRMFAALSVTARRVALMFSLPNRGLNQYLIAIRLTLTVDLVRDTLIIGLLEASASLPEAARLVQLLQSEEGS
ncbi:hypothetical protein JCM6882_001298, partial [Rhodosporidiobolus microsporus]